MKLAEIMRIGTILYTRYHGERVGEDTFGNEYYVEKNPPTNRRAKRWVMYKGEPEASKVPPEWHAWLHYTAEAPIRVQARPWMKPHQPNLTGTPHAYLPPGHDARGGKRDHATGDYEAWDPSAE